MKRLNLWSLVCISDPSECWPWAGPKTNGGYGTFRGTTAHRAVYERVVGPLLPDQVVMHTCDRPSCCNPEHLRAGTQQENIADMYAKNRNGDQRVFGEKHGRAKLSDSDVRCIFLLRSCGAVQQRLADAFGVGQSQIGRVLRGENRATPLLA